MKNNSLMEAVMCSTILLLFVGTLNAKPLDYEDVANLLPTEPQTINDTLAAIVQDPVVQDAVQDAVGNGSLEGLVVKKKVFVMPATEPNKVMSQREQVLVVPVMHLEDVRKNITETANEGADVDSLTFTDIQTFTENNEDEYENSKKENNPFYPSQHGDFYEALTEISRTTRKPIFPIDKIPQEIPYLVANPIQEITLPEHSSPTISVPIIAFLDPAKVSDDRIDMPIVTTLSRDDALKNQLEKERDEIQRNVQDYIDENSWSVDPNNWQLTSSPLKMQVSSLYEPRAIKTEHINENPLPIAMPSLDIATPLFWTSDADTNYPKDPYDMDAAADIVFRPLFRYRQEAQQKSYRRSTYRRYNSYDSYPRRNYRYRSRYSNDYY
ncbi:uncharacterized protein LOC126857672 [Cataglyphis hispanica]|uniref:uncharacterized protein LOC126857672 n=1 Tax=Cataglyphis hispanica TaxID=1086592 RepID=UPI002180344F|nr:uncharacterized protein LOC126857672 [Cataglyphis hispanica]